MNDDVDGAVLGEDPLEQGVDCRLVPDVGGHHQRAGRARRAALCGDQFEGLLAARGEHHMLPSCGELA